jgi:hypothetical protein
VVLLIDVGEIRLTIVRDRLRIRLLAQLDQSEQRVVRLEAPRVLVVLHQPFVLVRLGERLGEVAATRRELALPRENGRLRQPRIVGVVHRLGIGTHHRRVRR